jgi:hypothetical protein
MYEILKALATSNGWVFEYGRHDFQNLFKAAEQKNVSHIFLDPVKIRDIDNDSGITEKKVYSGSFMILFSSDIDEQDYDTRYQNYIKPIVSGDLKTIKDGIRCGYDVVFDLWETTEVVNIFDYNFDGLICTYQLTIDE